MTDLNVTVTAITQEIIVTQPQVSVQVGGVAGVQGKDGLTAYQVAVDNGFIGTEEQWIASLSITGVVIISPINVGGNRAVMADGNYADNLDQVTLSKVIGLTKTSATIGNPVEIITATELNGFSGLIPNAPIYLSENGTVTQNLPVYGYIQQVGVATTDSKALINILPPINRE